MIFLYLKPSIHIIFNGLSTVKEVRISLITSKAKDNFLLQYKLTVNKSVNPSTKEIFLSNPDNSTGVIHIKKERFYNKY